MLDRGYSDGDIEKVLSGNIMRVWQAVEAYAQVH
jgi:membrane dipeptidase